MNLNKMFEYTWMNALFLTKYKWPKLITFSLKVNRQYDLDCNLNSNLTSFVNLSENIYCGFSLDKFKSTVIGIDSLPGKFPQLWSRSFRLQFLIKNKKDERTFERKSFKRMKFIESLCKNEVSHYLEILQNSQENTCATVSFLIKLQALSLQLY